MNKLRCAQFLACLIVGGQAAVRASNLDVIGVTLLRTVTTNLNGAGIGVAQPEAYDSGTTNWEVNPANGQVQQPAGLFTYTSSFGSTNHFPNDLSGESGHADAVGGIFYGVPGGVATNVARVDNYDASYFVQVSYTVNGMMTNYSASLHSINTGDLVVNQSFIFINSDYSHVSADEQQAVDSAYDNDAAQYNTLFVSGAGNSGTVNPPATCYNGLGVGAYGGGSSTGPTVDNGRAKPDLVAPESETSWSTPEVAGAAAVLMQAGLRGDGGNDTNSAADIRTVKSLLLNGAIKPADWMNTAPSPLDTRYGAGVLDLFNSYKQLAGGKHGYIVSTGVSAGGAHPPTGASGSVNVLSGWDFNTNSSSSSSDTVNHYYFNVTNGVSHAAFTATATLVWDRHNNKTNINNLALFLYNAANSNLVACSTSLVDNVQHIFIPSLAQGRYDLQAWKAGGNFVSRSETYALAWEFFSDSLDIAGSGTNAVLSWPVYPDGFELETAASLAAPVVWNTNNPAPVVTNDQNVVLLNATNTGRFFRLWRP